MGGNSGLGSGAAQLSPVRLPQPRNGRGCAGLEPPLGGPGRGLRRPPSSPQRALRTKGSGHGCGDPGAPLAPLRPERMNAREDEPAYRSGDEAIVRTPLWSEREEARAGWLAACELTGTAVKLHLRPT